MRIQRLLHCAAFAGFFALSFTPAHAKSLLLDFGPTAVSGNFVTNSPASASGLVPSGETNWNTSLTVDTSSLIYSDGTAASGVALTLGRSAAGVATVNFSDKGYANGALGGAHNGGLYAGTSPVKDGIWGGSGAANAYAIGLRLDGLPAGVYTVVIHGRNTSTGNGTGATPERFYGATGPGGGTFSFSTANVNALAANSVPANTNSFVLGDNYNQLELTVAAGQSLFIAAAGTTAVELRGFFNTVEVVSGTGTVPARMSVQPPATQRVLEGITSYSIAGAQFVGSSPVLSQWYFNGTNLLAGATNATLTLSNITLAMAGNYNLYVSNAWGSDFSSNAVLNVTPVARTGELTNLWNLLPGDRYYVTTSNTNAERGIAFNPVNSNLLMVCRWPSNNLVVLDALTGAEKRMMDVTGIAGSIPNVGLGMSLVGVADDGVVYASSVTVNASSGPLMIYRWDDDSATAVPGLVYSADPTGTGLRWGDNFAVRGGGANTQLLLAPGSGTNVLLLRSTSGRDFQNEVPPTVIVVSGVPSGFAAAGIAFGPQSDTFWAKNYNNQLYLVQFNLTTGTGTVLNAYPVTLVPGSVGVVGASSALNLLTGLSIDQPDNVRLYSVSDLTAGPMLVDQALFTVKNANVTQGGTGAAAFGSKYLFVLDSNNGVKAFAINTNAVIPARITTQPASQTVWESMPTATIGAAYQGSAPVSCQWSFNGTPLPGATNNTLVLSNVTVAMAGSYTLAVTNLYGRDISSNAVLTVRPILDTAQMSNIWNLMPGDSPYLGTANTERGIAFNPLTTNLLLVSRAAGPNIVVLDGPTGGEKHLMNVSGINPDVPGVSLGLNSAGVGSDGVVFAGSITVNASTTPYYLYRWADDSAGSYSTMVFGGDPAYAVQPGLRWGDNLAIRGAGADTQVLLAPGSGTNVVLLRTSTGFDFMNEVPPAVLAISGVPSGFAQLGIAFGPGANTFWAKTGTNQLYLVQYDLAASTGAVLYAYSTNAVPSSVRGISVDDTQKFLAGVSVENPDNVRLYDIANLSVGPQMRDQELFATQNANTLFGGVASTAIGGGYVFALDCNNGLKAFLLNTSYQPALPPFSIRNASLQAGTGLVLSWDSVAGHTYQVQAKDSPEQIGWADVGSAMLATGPVSSSTNSVTGSARFFRVQGR